MREPAPSTTTDSARPASFSTAVLSMVAPAPMRMSFFVIGRESLELDVEHVRLPEAAPETQLPFLVRGQGRRCRQSAPVKRHGRCAWKDAALIVFDRADEGACQSLRDRGPRQQDARGSDEGQQGPTDSSCRWCRWLGVHSTILLARTVGVRKRNSVIGTSRTNMLMERRQRVTDAR